MSALRVVHTSELGNELLEALRLLLGDAFDGDVTDHDYEHTLGGMHALVEDGDELVAHGSVVLRRLLHDGHALRTGYVEGVAVRTDRRGLGYGAAVMDALERVVRGGYEIGALSSSEQAQDFYAARGWRVWNGTASAITPQGLLRTEDEDGGIYVLAGLAEAPVAGDLACDWRDGDLW